MLTINDFALMDEFWKSTKYSGPVGAEILNILRSGKSIFHGNFEFDVEFKSRDGKSVIPGLYIVKGFPHGSDEEVLLIKEIVKYYRINTLPALWENDDFLKIDREIALNELAAFRQPRPVNDNVRILSEDCMRVRGGRGTIRGPEIHYLNEAFRDSVQVKLESPQSGASYEPCTPGIYAIWSCNGEHFQTLIDDNFTESFLAQIDALRIREMLLEWPSLSEEEFVGKIEKIRG